MKPADDGKLEFRESDRLMTIKLRQRGMNLRPPSVLAFVKTIGKARLIQLPDELIVNEVFRLDRFALGHVDGFQHSRHPGQCRILFSRQFVLRNVPVVGFIHDLAIGYPHVFLHHSKCQRSRL